MIFLFLSGLYFIIVLTYFGGQSVPDVAFGRPFKLAPVSLGDAHIIF